MLVWRNKCLVKFNGYATYSLVMSAKTAFYLRNIQMLSKSLELTHITVQLLINQTPYAKYGQLI